MPDPLKSRELSESEFNAIKKKVIDAAPDGLGEQDFRRYFGPAMEQALAEAEFTAAPLEGSALGRAASNFGAMINPVTLVKGVGSAIAHPVETGEALIGAQLAQWDKAKDDASVAMRARPGGAGQALSALSAVGHGIAAAVPLVGPMAAAAGEQMASGDVAGGLGTGAGLLAPMGVKPAIKAARAAVPAGAKAGLAANLESAAQGKMERLIAPNIGQNKVRFGGDAAEVAPRLTTEPGMGAPSMQRFSGKVAERLTGAEALLDEATDARLSALTFDSAPIRKALLEKRQSLTSETVQASEYPRTYVPDKGGGAMPKPSGQDVVTGPRKPRVDVIDQAIAELDQLGPKVSYEAIKRMRQAYDGPAKAIYHPSTTADFLKAQGGKQGAADVTGTLRTHLGEWDPATAVANKEYAYWKKTTDVLDALEETERTRPKVGRALAAKLVGGMVGTAAGGGLGGAIGAASGAAVGAYLADLAEVAVGAGPTSQIAVARQMTRLAAALRKGDVGAANAAAFNLRQLGAELAKQGAKRTPRAVGEANERESKTPGLTVVGLK